jgi:hypothetical protein
LASKAAEEAAGLETRFGATDRALADLSAQIDNQFAQVDKRFAQVDAQIDVRFAQVESSFAVVNGRIEKLQWMLGVVLASTGAILIKLFIPH